ncbi:MAG TPA: hypothetical protein EYP59_12535 [Thiotrichaceae bacterium]|nr:hypothetical protein [Thiotrichaceae bacterium]
MPSFSLNTPASYADVIAQHIETYDNLQLLHRLPLTIQDDQFKVDAEVELTELVTAANVTEHLERTLGMARGDLLFTIALSALQF